MDLLSERPFWPIRDGLPATFPPLEKTTSCDVAIVGAGISGAMTAYLLARAGLEVVVLDRREAAHGSTSGNTGLLLYETDQPMVRLERRLGRAAAQQAYRRCHAAVREVEKLAKRAAIECGFRRRENLYLAANRSHVAWLKREHALRAETGFDVEWWPRNRIARESTLPHAAGIFSRGSAELDAYRLAYGLLLAAQHDGATVHDRTEVTSWRFRRSGVELLTSRGHRVRARHLVVASGYEAGRFLPRPYGQLHSTFALVSEPLTDFPGWPRKGCLLWDTGDPYLYLRLTDDGRAMIGGYDEPFRDPRARDRLLPAKAAALHRRFRQLFPNIPFEVATAWAGTFGVTEDGLPYIGRHPAVPHTWFALGFGGNGTTFSLIAAEMVRAGILGERDPDAELFGFGRAERAKPKA